MSLSGTQHAFAFEFPPLLAKPGTQKNTLRYTGVWLPTPDAPRESGLFQQQSATGSIVLSQNKTELWSLSLKSRWHRPAATGVLPSSGTLVPKDLWDEQVGGFYLHRSENDSIWATSLALGSASDQPFSGLDVTTVNATGFYGFPDGHASRWLLILNYSNNRQILNNLPLPGVAYFYAPSKSFQATFGLPFAAVRWLPAEGWQLSFSTLLPWVVKAEVGYKIYGPVQVFAGFDFSQDLFLRKGRSESSERLYYDSKRLLLGTRSPVSKVLSAELSIAHAFDRSYFEGTRYNRRTGGTLELAPALLLAIGLSAAF